MKRLRKGGFVARAARLVPVCDVLEWVNIPTPGTPPEGVSVKVTCPFSETHPPDRIGEKDMRLYNDGKAFCHICAAQYDSVALAAQLWGLSRVEAAKAILSKAGLDITAESESLESLIVPVRPEQLRTDAVAALGVWADVRGVDRFSEPYSRCLALADQIVEQHHVGAWLTACKDFLTQNMVNDNA